jgi:replication fork clamp-binding protein CrfC
VVPLKRGYIGVVNRGQQDILEKKDIGSALKAEEEFIAGHPKYCRIAGRMGTPYLGKMLNAILLQHIREVLPELKAKVHDLIAHTSTVLRQLGDNEIAVMSSGGLLLNLLTRYSNSVVATIDGSKSDSITKTELTGGARINFIFTQAFGPYIMSMKPCEGLTDEHIRTAIDNAKGPRSALFIPEQAFEMLVRQQVSRLEEPCLKCCDHVFDELVKICEQAEKELIQYPQLRTRVNEQVVKLLREYMNPLRDFICNLIKIELAYINTNHPHFYGGGSVFEQMTPQMVAPPGPGGHPEHAPIGPGDKTPRLGSSNFTDMPSHIRQDIRHMTERQKRETEVIKQLLTTYFGIIQISIQDKIPKAIVHFLINKVKSDIQNELVATFYNESLFEELLAESDEVAKKRSAAKKMLGCLQQAAAVLHEIRDFRL